MLSIDQQTAFQVNGGFTTDQLGTLILLFVFVVALLWGVWAMYTAYQGWASNNLTFRQFGIVCIRFFALYLLLSFFLLS